VHKGPFFEKGRLRELVVSRTASKTPGGRGGNPHYPFGDGEVVGKAGVVPFKWRSGLRLGDLVGAGLGFRGNGIAWLLTRGLVLLFAAPLRAVDLCLDGRGRGLGFGWGERLRAGFFAAAW